MTEHQIVLNKLTATVSLLCEEVAHLVDDRASREPEENRAGVRGKADSLREAGRELRRAQNMSE